MRKFKLLILLSLIINVAYSQSIARIDFDEVVHDFGTIKETDGVVSFKFTFTNIGKKNLIIQDVKSTCGCTTPNWTKEPVKPGKQGFVSAAYNPANQKGHFNKTITVTANTSPNKVFLKITGNVIAKPKTILDEYRTNIGSLRFKTKHVALGDISSLATDTGKIEMYNPTDQRIRIYAYDAPSYVTLDKMPVIVLPKQRGILNIYYNAVQKNDLGYVFDRFTLKTDDKVKPDKELIVVANIKQDFSNLTEEERKNTAVIKFEKNEHNFGKVRKGAVVEYDFKFKNEGKYTLVVYNVQSSCGCTGTAMGKRKLAPGEEGTINVKFNSRGKKGIVKNTLKVFTNDISRPETILKIYADVVEEKDKK